MKINPGELYADEQETAFDADEPLVCDVCGGSLLRAGNDEQITRADCPLVCLTCEPDDDADEHCPHCGEWLYRDGVWHVVCPACRRNTLFPENDAQGRSGQSRLDSALIVMGCIVAVALIILAAIAAGWRP